MSEPLEIQRRGAVVIVSINDAPYNRMSLALMDQLETTTSALERDEAVRAVVVTGAGGENFSVGMDLKELPRGIQIKGGADALFDQRLKVLSTIENFRPIYEAMVRSDPDGFKRSFDLAAAVKHSN